MFYSSFAIVTPGVSPGIPSGLLLKPFPLFSTELLPEFIPIEICPKWRHIISQHLPIASYTYYSPNKTDSRGTASTNMNRVFVCVCAAVQRSLNTENNKNEFIGAKIFLRVVPTIL